MVEAPCFFNYQTGKLYVMRRFVSLIIISSICFFALSPIVKSQNAVLESLNTAPLNDQYETLEKRTLTYDNFRAVREDYFQLIKTNTIDSLNEAKEEIANLKTRINTSNTEIKSLNSRVAEAEAAQLAAEKTKDSFLFFGKEMKKNVYNTLMWSIVGVLLALFFFFFIFFSKNRSETKTAKEELFHLKQEFEEYKTKSRLDREKMTMEHFREVQRLKNV